MCFLLKGVEIAISSVQMKVSTILICITIGHVFGELESSKNGEESWRVKDDMKDYGSRDYVDVDKTPAADVKNFRGKYAKINIFSQIPESTKDADSIGKETSRKPSPVIEISTVKPTSFKAVKNNVEIAYLRKPAKHLNELQNIINAKNTSFDGTGWIYFFRSFLWVALRRAKTNFPSNERKLLRRRRQVDDPEDNVLSYRVFNKLRRKVPLSLRLKIRETQLAEDNLLEYYVGAGTADEYRLREYNRTRFDELEEFKRQVDKAGDKGEELIATYKALRKGTPWNYDKLRHKYKTFFEKESLARTEFETMKAKEHSWIDCFLNGTNVTILAAAGPKDYVKAEEMLRGVRAKEIETVDAEGDAHTENAEDVVATTDDAEVDVTNTAITTPTSENKHVY